MNRPSRVAPGQPFRPRAADWNSFVDAAIAAQSAPSATGDQAAQPRDRATILVRNVGASDIEMWDAVAIVAPIVQPSENVDEFERRVAMTGRTPTEDDVEGKASVAIAQEPIAQGSIGRCAVSGMTVAVVDVADESQRFAAIEDGEARLQGAATGPLLIVWKESGAGDGKRAVVSFAPVPGVRWFHVIGSTEFAPHRCDYTLQAVDDESFEVVGRNTIERSNTADLAGPSYDLTTLPPSWEWLPIGKTLGGTDIWCVVAAWEEDLDGEPRWWFTATNIVDGPCGEEDLFVPYAAFGAAGDIVVGTADGDAEPLPAGADGAILTADSAESTGLRWDEDATLVAGVLTLPNGGLHLLDTDASHDLVFAAGSDLTGDRTLTITTGDANRTLTISANTTLAGGSHSGTNTGDQAGCLLGIHVHTSGTTHTTAAGCNAIRVVMVGGGGGGGGVANTSSRSGAGGGGGAGGYVERWFAASPSTGYAYAVGGGGGGATAGANDGADGGDSTFTVGGTTVTAKRGSGGKGCTGATGVVALGGAGGIASTNGDLNGAGAPGAPGISTTAVVAVSGAGASGRFGGGANGIASQGTGVAAIGYGSGGSGGCSINGGGSAAGGAGSSGVVIVEEYS